MSGSSTVSGTSDCALAARSIEPRHDAAQESITTLTTSDPTRRPTTPRVFQRGRPASRMVTVWLRRCSGSDAPRGRRCILGGGQLLVDDRKTPVPEGRIGKIAVDDPPEIFRA